MSLSHVQFTTKYELADTLERAKEAGCELVLIDTPLGRTEEETIRGVAKGHCLETAPTVFQEYQVHRDGSFQGMTAQELQPDSKARWYLVDSPGRTQNSGRVPSERQVA